MAAREVRPRILRGLTIPVTVVIVLFIVKAVNPISYDPDLYWHLKTGEYILTHGVLPHADVFSSTAYGRDWVLHEWLSEALFYGVVRVAGLQALWIFVACLYAATFVVLYRTCAQALEKPTSALVVALLFFAPFVAFATPRPQIFTYLMFAIYLASLIEWKRSGDAGKLKRLPWLMLAWVNLHGAAIVGIALLLLFIATEAISLWLGGGKRRSARDLKALCFWTALTALATLANPRFVEYWLYPFHVMGLTVATSVINEWKSPNFHTLYFRYFLALFLGFFGVLLYSRRRPDLTEFAVPVFFIAAGFTSVRHLPLACIAAAPFFAAAWQAIELPAWRVPARFASLRRLNREVDDRHAPYLNLLLLCAVVAAMTYSQSRRSSATLLDAMMPVKAADYVVRNDITGRMFNEYGEGGYLIYRLYPRVKVFIDGRADVYGDAFMKEYLAIVGGKPDWKRRFDRYAIDFAVLPRELPLRQLLLAGRRFKLVYDDARYSVLVRDVPKFSYLPRIAPLAAMSPQATR
jgi:hypothetical protein